MPTRPKKLGLGLSMKTLTGNDGKSYLVFRTPEGAFHTFTEVEAKQAARECGAKHSGTTRQMWERIWRSV